MIVWSPTSYFYFWGAAWLCGKMMGRWGTGSINRNPPMESTGRTDWMFVFAVLNIWHDHKALILMKQITLCFSPPSLLSHVQNLKEVLELPIKHPLQVTAWTRTTLFSQKYADLCGWAENQNKWKCEYWLTKHVYIRQPCALSPPDRWDYIAICCSHIRITQFCPYNRLELATQEINERWKNGE